MSGAKQEGELSPIQRDFTKERDERCKPVALQILRIIADEGDNLLIGDKNQMDEDVLKYYVDLYTNKIAPLILEHGDMQIGDVTYAFQLAMQAIDFTMQRTTMTLEMRMNQAVAKQFGVDDVNDVTINDLQRVLKAGAEGEQPVDNSPSEPKV